MDSWGPLLGACAAPFGGPRPFLETAARAFLAAGATGVELSWRDDAQALGEPVVAVWPLGASGRLGLAGLDAAEPEIAMAVALVRLWLEASEQREALTRQLDRELALRESIRTVVNHDLRNPLAVILGEVELMRAGVQSVRSLDSLDRQSHRLLKMVDDLALNMRRGPPGV